MKEVSDNEFDRLFREKSENFDYQFEEEAWDLMEKKLRKRDRIVYLQRFSIAALFLLCMGTGLYWFTSDNTIEAPLQAQQKGLRNTQSINTKAKSPKVQEKPVSQRDTSIQAISEEGTAPRIAATAENDKPHHAATTVQAASSTPQNRVEKKRRRILNTSTNPAMRLAALTPQKRTAADIPDTPEALPYTNDSRIDSLHYLASIHVFPGKDPAGEITVLTAPHATSSLSTPVLPHAKPQLSFTLAAGPDYSSVQSIKGKEGNVNIGLLFNATYKKFTLSTGARYGLKKYSASGFDYALSNPANASYITKINAECNVIEIPAQLSYKLVSFNHQQIDISSGLSSYLMLRERYQFSYKAETGRPDYNLQKVNENRSFFGVVSLSAAYKFKPTKQPILFGIEPYAKLPLGGVGEGKVRLKSSGVALTMTYELIKRN